MEDKNSCLGCIWYSQCASHKCEFYDDNEESEYYWSEMFYNRNNQDNTLEDNIDIYSSEEMIYWFNEVGKLR